MSEKITILKLTSQLNKPNKITKIRKNEAIIEINLESGLLEYDVKIDYDQDIILEGESEEVNLAYKKYEKGVIHLSDIVGIWSSTTPEYEKEQQEDGSEVINENYNHSIEISTVGNPLYFFIEYKELKPTYETLRELFIKYKTRNK